MALLDQKLTQISPRTMGRVNTLGLWTLYNREVKRFLSVFTQTLMAPVITTLLFLAVFALALGGLSRTVGGVDYITFLAPGLMMMTMTQNSFANTSSSILIAKVQGNIVDILMPPLAPWEMTLAFAAGGITRGLMVGLTVFVAMMVFLPVSVAHPLSALWFAINACLMMALLGMLWGIWAQKYDHIAAVTNFIITPLSFLSGTFYSIDRLPVAWQTAAQFNPFFYMIDGFRYGFIGHADGNILVGSILLPSVNICLWLVTHRMISTGYRLKA